MECREIEKPFKCDSCSACFTNEDHLQVHRRRHEMSLNLNLNSLNKSELQLENYTDSTPTPTRFLRMTEDVGFFTELQNVNPFDEQFSKAASSPIFPYSPTSSQTSSICLNDTLNTPQILIGFPSANQEASCQNLNILANQEASGGSLDFSANKEPSRGSLNILTNREASRGSLNLSANEEASRNFSANQKPSLQNLNTLTNQEASRGNFIFSANQESSRVNLNFSANEEPSRNNLNFLTNQEASKRSLNILTNQEASRESFNILANQEASRGNLNILANQEASRNNLNFSANQEASRGNLNILANQSSSLNLNLLNLSNHSSKNERFNNNESELNSNLMNLANISTALNENNLNITNRSALIGLKLANQRPGNLNLIPSNQNAANSKPKSHLTSIVVKISQEVKNSNLNDLNLQLAHQKAPNFETTNQEASFSESANQEASNFKTTNEEALFSESANQEALNFESTNEKSPKSNKNEILERNRAAAIRSRQRRKLWINELEIKSNGLEKLVREANAKISVLLQENERLKTELLEKNKKCNCECECGKKSKGTAQLQNSQFFTPSILKRQKLENNEEKTEIYVDYQKEESQIIEINQNQTNLINDSIDVKKKGRPRKGEEKRASGGFLIPLSIGISNTQFQIANPIKIKLVPLPKK